MSLALYQDLIAAKGEKLGYVYITRNNDNTVSKSQAIKPESGAVFKYATIDKSQVMTIFQSFMSEVPIYEIIYVDFPCRPYFDIDEISIDDVIKVVETIIEYYKLFFNVYISPADVHLALREKKLNLFTRKSGPNGLSMHIHISSQVHSNNRELFVVACEINDILFKSGIYTVLDARVYNSTQLFRFPYKYKTLKSTKHDILLPMTYVHFKKNMARYQNMSVDKWSYIQIKDFIPQNYFITPFTSDQAHLTKIQGKIDDNMISTEIFKYVSAKLNELRVDDSNLYYAVDNIIRFMKSIENSIRMRIMVMEYIQKMAGDALADVIDKLSGYKDNESGVIYFDNMRAWNDAVMPMPRSEIKQRFDLFIERLIAANHKQISPERIETVFNLDKESRILDKNLPWTIVRTITSKLDCSLTISIFLEHNGIGCISIIVCSSRPTEFELFDEYDNVIEVEWRDITKSMTNAKFAEFL